MSRRNGVARGSAARLGLFAVLFQAILFGWHHHELAFAGHQAAPAASHPNAPPQPIDDEDCCDICQVLHHLTAAPADLPAAPPPLAIAEGPTTPEAAFVTGDPTLAFHAEPLLSSDAAIG